MQPTILSEKLVHLYAAIFYPTDIAYNTLCALLTVEPINIGTYALDSDVKFLGPAPIRRTLKFLEAGRLILKDQIKIMAVHYNLNGQNNKGTKEFVFWYLPQIQYKNPNVQIATFKNLTPSPFVRFFYDTGDEMFVDVDNKNKEEIYEHLIRVVGKTKDVLEAESISKEKKDNPANFGVGCDRHCICEIPGQIPCPGIVPLPHHMRGKFIYKKE